MPGPGFTPPPVSGVLPSQASPHASPPGLATAAAARAAPRPAQANPAAGGGANTFMPPVTQNKGFMGAAQSFAKGGAVLGKTSSFLKTPDRFRGGKAPKVEGTEDSFAKTGKGTQGRDKSEKAILPRK